MAAASPVCQALREFGDQHEAVFKYMYLQLVIIKRRPPCVDTLALNATETAGVDQSAGGVGVLVKPTGCSDIVRKTQSDLG